MKLEEIIPEINRKTEPYTNFGEQEPKPKKRKLIKKERLSRLPEIRPAELEGY